MYIRHNVDEVDNLGATHLIVYQLMAPYLGKGHEVYMDSYYTTPDQDTGLWGTVSRNRRGMPRQLRSTDLDLRKGGDVVFMTHEKRR